MSRNKKVYANIYNYPILEKQTDTNYSTIYNDNSLTITDPIDLYSRIVFGLIIIIIIIFNMMKLISVSYQDYKIKKLQEQLKTAKDARKKTKIKEKLNHYLFLKNNGCHNYNKSFNCSNCQFENCPYCGKEEEAL